jgi:hypothetical protein
MANAKECERGHIIHGYFSLLPKIHKKKINIASLISSLQKKGMEFEWTSKCEEIFQ